MAGKLIVTRGGLVPWGAVCFEGYMSLDSMNINWRLTHVRLFDELLRVYLIILRKEMYYLQEQYDTLTASDFYCTQRLLEVIESLIDKMDTSA